MGQIAYRANLSAATFPMTIAESGRTVIVPGPDNNFDRRVDPTGAQKDAGIPQALYMENVLPTVSGYQSVGYISPQYPVAAAAGDPIIEMVIVPASYIADTISYEYLYLTSAGVVLGGYLGNYTVTFPAGGSLHWTQKISTAVVGNTCYLYNGFDLFEVVRGGTTSLILTAVTAAVTPAGFLSSAGILTICGSRNYLIAVGATTVHYSSTTTATDFVASLVSGAGEIGVGNVLSYLAYAHGTQDGFYLFSNQGAYYAQYTGNARYPWKFNVVRGAVGIDESYFNLKKCIAYNGVSDEIYVIEKDLSLKLYAKTQAQAILPEVTELLQKKRAQTLFNYVANTFSTSTVVTDRPSLYLWDSRFLFIAINETDSLGASNNKGYANALVFDVTTMRMGKLRLPFRYMFSLSRTSSMWDSPRTQMVFVDPLTNLVKILNLDIYDVDGRISTSETFDPMEGVLILGKFQYVRSRKMKIEEIEIEGPQNTSLEASPNFSCVLIPSQDGRNFDAPEVLTARTISGGLATYYTHRTAQNHSICIKGAFSADTVQLRFVPAGDR